VARKKKRNKKQSPRKISGIIPAGKGYDFGLRQNVMLVSGHTFNQELIDAKIIGCAYGYIPLNSPTGIIPFITLAGRDKDKLIEAYKHCSGLIEPDTLIRDNIYQLLRCRNGTKTNEQTVFKRKK
jgi:hypothetical protein